MVRLTFLKTWPDKTTLLSQNEASRISSTAFQQRQRMLYQPGTMEGRECRGLFLYASAWTICKTKKRGKFFFSAHTGILARWLVGENRQLDPKRMPGAEIRPEWTACKCCSMRDCQTASADWWRLSGHVADTSGTASPTGNPAAAADGPERGCNPTNGRPLFDLLAPSNPDLPMEAPCLEDITRKQTKRCSWC